MPMLFTESTERLTGRLLSERTDSRCLAKADPLDRTLEIGVEGKRRGVSVHCRTNCSLRLWVDLTYLATGVAALEAAAAVGRALLRTHVCAFFACGASRG